MTAALRQLLRSEARRVLIEAPAGCGKTHEAASLAMDAVGQLSVGQKILLLAHTNAAKEEFTRRTKSAGGRIEVSTIDSMSARILGPYASAFGLPTPLERNIGPRGEGVPFRDLALKTVELFARAPTIARLEGAKFPLIIGDEHQDADANQHSVLMRLADAGGGRLRLFGDPMQGIFEVGDAVPWSELKEQVDACGRLDVPKRWRMTRETRLLGEWILEVRAALEGGRPLPLATAPESVAVARCDQTRGNAYRQRNPQAIRPHVLQFVQAAGQDSLSVLTFPNDAVLTIESAAHFLGLKVNEGADYEDAYRLLDRAIEADGDPARISHLLLDHIRSSSVGVRQDDHDRLAGMFGPDQIVRPPRGRLSPFSRVFEPIYRDCSLLGLFAACRRVRTVDIPDFRLRKVLCLRLLANLSKQDGDAAKDELSAVIAARKALSAKPTRAASTIHKAKGLEFGRVLIAFCGSSHFPDTELRRRLLYVAISRATNALTLHVPTDSPSPLIGNA